MIVRDLPDIDLVRAGIRLHHEQWDGAGYLEGLRGEEIPLVARILAVADAFSAMTTSRPYRKALSIKEALTRLVDAAGSRLDPTIRARLRPSAMEWTRRASAGHPRVRCHPRFARAGEPSRPNAMRSLPRLAAAAVVAGWLGRGHAGAWSRLRHEPPCRCRRGWCRRCRCRPAAPAPLPTSTAASKPTPRPTLALPIFHCPRWHRYPRWPSPR